MNFSEYKFLKELLETPSQQKDETYGDLLKEVIKIGTTFRDDFSEESKLKYNEIGKIYDDYKTLKEKDEEPAMPQQPKSAGDESGTSRGCPADLRILEMGVDNFRAFPKSKRKYGLQFHPLEKEPPEPWSFMGIGSNGVGKSSFFGALEWKCNNRVSECEFRNSDTDTEAKCAPEDFIKHYGTNSAETSNDDIIIKTVSGRSDFEKFTLSPFFCTEKDLIDMVREMPKGEDKDWIPYIFNFSGYRLISNFIDNLLTLHKEMEEIEMAPGSVIYSGMEQKVYDAIDKFNQMDISTKAINDFTSIEFKPLISFFNTVRRFNKAKPEKVEKSLEELSKFLDLFEKKVNAVPLFEKPEKEAYQKMIAGFRVWPEEIERIKRGVEDIDTFQSKCHREIDHLTITHKQQSKDLRGRMVDFSTTFVESLEKIKEKSILYPMDKNPERWKRMKSNLQNLYDLCGEIRTQIAKEIADENFFRNIEVFLTENQFLEKESEELVHDTREDIKFNVRKKIDSPTGVVPVAVYFNTFRTKLVALLIRVSIAKAIMARENFRFPLVFDDIFYSSDFENKKKLSAFFRNLLTPKSHEGDSGKGEKSEGKSDLQIIFFTHDELMVSLNQEWVENREPAEEEDDGPRVIPARIFGPSIVKDEWRRGTFEITVNGVSTPCVNMAINLLGNDI